MKPLDGVKVLDLTRLLPGALLTQTLFNFGAEVWKVEAPGRGDHARDMPPLIDGTGAYFLLTNGGKKSLALNLKHEQGKQALLRLVAKADVLVEGFRPGVMERLNLGYEHLSAQNPRLIYVALTGYGQDGPYARRPGHDINYAALAGVLHSSGARQPFGVLLADVSGAQHGFAGVLLALLSRAKTGHGQKVDVSMFEALLPFLAAPLAEYAVNGNAEAGVLTGKYACYKLYEAGDGSLLALGALEPKFWTAFCTAVGLPHLTEVQFSREQQPEVIATVAEVLRTKTAKEWLAIFDRVDTCVTLVNDIPGLLDHPHLAARRAFMPSKNGVPVLNAIPKLSRSPGAAGGHPPRLGEHTREILSALGYSDQQISDLARQGIAQLKPE